MTKLEKAGEELFEALASLEIGTFRHKKKGPGGWPEYIGYDEGRRIEDAMDRMRTALAEKANEAK